MSLKTTFSNKISFLSLSVLSASEIEQKLLAFPRKNQLVVKTAFYVPKATFFEKIKIRNKICLLSFWDMWQKILAFCKFFLLLCQNFILPVHTNFYTIFISKNSQLFSTFWHLKKNKLQLFVMKSLAGFSKFQFYVSTGTYGGKKVETFELFLSVSKVEPYIFGF